MPIYSTNEKMPRKEKEKEKYTRGGVLLPDNSPVRKSRVAMTALHRRGFRTFIRSPYSPDLAPSNYYLYPKFKKFC